MPTKKSKNPHISDRIGVLNLKVSNLVIEMLRLNVLFNQIVAVVKNFWENIDQKLFFLIFDQLANISCHLFSDLFILIDHFKQKSIHLSWRLQFSDHIENQIFEKSKLSQQLLLFMTIWVQIINQVRDPLAVRHSL